MDKSQSGRIIEKVFFGCIQITGYIGGDPVTEEGRVRIYILMFYDFFFGPLRHISGQNKVFLIRRKTAYESGHARRDFNEIGSVLISCIDIWFTDTLNILEIFSKCIFYFFFAALKFLIDLFFYGVQIWSIHFAFLKKIGNSRAVKNLSFLQILAHDKFTTGVWYWRGVTPGTPIPTCATTIATTLAATEVDIDAVIQHKFVKTG